MTYMMRKDTTATLPATAKRHADRSWSAEFAGIIAYGPTLATARATLAESIAAVIRHASQSPAFARDDDGTLIVAVPDGTGVASWRVTDESARLTCHSTGTPWETVASVHHYSPIPNR